MSTFSADVARFAKKANASIDLITRKVTLDLFADVVRRTPVDTGRLKGSWVASQHAPNLSKLTYTDKEGNTTIARIAQQIGGAGSVTYLVNTQPYSVRIEYDGHSAQAPAGMVRVSMARVQQHLRAAVREHKV